MELRPFTDADRGMVEGWMDAVAREFLEDGWPSLGSLTDHPATHALVGSDDGVPVGVALLDFYADDEALVSMLVAPDARGRGVGRRLVRAAVDSSDARIVKADVLIENVASAATLLAAGCTEMVPPEDEIPQGRFFVWTRDGVPYEPRWG